MSLTQWLLLVFVVLELLNVLTLYFAPGSNKGNGVGVFNAWHNRNANPQSAALIEYLVNWVAGVKLIFIGLILLIVFRGDAVMHKLAAVILIITTLSFYWRLNQIIKQQDNKGEISPAGYSKILNIMIAVFCMIFVVAALV